MGYPIKWLFVVLRPVSAAAERKIIFLYFQFFLMCNKIRYTQNTMETHDTVCTNETSYQLDQLYIHKNKE